jgi:hypothetical protein
LAGSQSNFQKLEIPTEYILFEYRQSGTDLVYKGEQILQLVKRLWFTDPYVGTDSGYRVPQVGPGCPAKARNAVNCLLRRKAVR